MINALHFLRHIFYTMHNNIASISHVFSQASLSSFPPASSSSSALASSSFSSAPALSFSYEAPCNNVGSVHDPLETREIPLEPVVHDCNSVHNPDLTENPEDTSSELLEDESDQEAENVQLYPLKLEMAFESWKELDE
jgi:hypothetical protein